MEREYQQVLELTHQMLSAATRQDWDALAGLEQLRTKLISTIQPSSSLSRQTSPAQVQRIADLIKKIGRENDEIIEHTQVWQEHVRVLLRLDKPPAKSTANLTR